VRMAGWSGSQAIARRLLLRAGRQATGISFAAPTRTRDESRKYRRATLERGDRLRATARRAPAAGRGRAHACAHTRARRRFVAAMLLAGWQAPVRGGSRSPPQVRDDRQYPWR